MLLVKKTSFWQRCYEITENGRLLAVWDKSMWKSGGTIDLGGRRYLVSSNMWGGKYGMATEDGTRVAAAERVGRKHWTVESDGRTYEFRRASMWRHDQELLSGGQPVGSISKPSMWRSDAQAELPGLPLPLQVFVIAVVLTMWDQAAAAAASS